MPLMVADKEWTNRLIDENWPVLMLALMRHKVTTHREKNLYLAGVVAGLQLAAVDLLGEDAVKP